MHPKAHLAPKKLGVKGVSKPKKVSCTPPPPAFTHEELVELRRLSAALPPTRRTSNPSETVQNAALYIQQLVATVRARVANGTLPQECLSHLAPQDQQPLRPRKSQRRSIEKKR